MNKATIYQTVRKLCPSAVLEENAKEQTLIVTVKGAPILNDDWVAEPFAMYAPLVEWLYDNCIVWNDDYNVYYYGFDTIMVELRVAS